MNSARTEWARRPPDGTFGEALAAKLVMCNGDERIQADVAERQRFVGGRAA